MTDGGDGAHGDETDRLASDHSEDEPATPETRPDGSTAADSRRTRSVEDGESPAPGSAPGEQTNSVLAEPTRARLAQIQTQTAELERGPITEYTTDRRSLDSTVQIQWTIRVTILAVVLGLLLTAVLSALPVPMQFGLLAIGLLLALGVVWVVLSYRVWVYQIREDSLYLERGVVTHVRTIVPYVRIQHVDTSRSALERALGLSTLVVYTAGSRGADVSVPGLKPNEARDLQQRLKELAIEADGDDAL
ncbi:PH domain-containing protein [Halovenus sp. HT40]|uniref:PH domain-containing protein n=1 Tax=Halovenus sp. HT40 TaxID=3126691 RepID=UPI00300EC761